MLGQIARVAQVACARSYAVGVGSIQQTPSAKAERIRDDQIMRLREHNTEASSKLPTGLSVSVLGAPTACGSVGSSVLVRYPGGSFMYGCGEGTHRELLKQGAPELAQLNCIFVSSHDQAEGVPGVVNAVRRVSRVARGGSAQPPAVTVFSPSGLDQQLLCTLDTTAEEDMSEFAVQPLVKKAAQSYVDPGLVEFGSEGGSSFVAHAFALGKPMSLASTSSSASSSSSLESWGFVIQEKDGWKNPALPDSWEPIERNPDIEQLEREGLSTILGFKGFDEFIKDDSEIPVHRGRKIVLIGDASDPSSIVPYAQGADLVIHEAAVPSEQQPASSIPMVVKFAADIKAKRLIITRVPSDSQVAIPSHPKVKIEVVKPPWTFDLAPAALITNKTRKN